MRELIEFAERIDSPIAMTLLGLGGVPASHRLNLGMMGIHGEAWVDPCDPEADLLMAFRWVRRPHHRQHQDLRAGGEDHVDIDASGINQNIIINTPIEADLRETLKDLLEVINRANHAPWMSIYIDSIEGHTAVRDIQTLPDSGHLYAAHIINNMAHHRGKGGGSHRRRPAPMWKVAECPSAPRRRNRWSAHRGSLGTMGLALQQPWAEIAGRRSVDDVGDSGFQMTQPVERPLRRKASSDRTCPSSTTAVFGMVRQWQERLYERRYAATPLRSPNFVKIAERSTGLKAEDDTRARCST